MKQRTIPYQSKFILSTGIKGGVSNYGTCHWHSFKTACWCMFQEGQNQVFLGDGVQIQIIKNECLLFEQECSSDNVSPAWTIYKWTILIQKIPILVNCQQPISVNFNFLVGTIGEEGACQGWEMCRE